MEKNKESTGKSRVAKRLSFPEAEKKHDWLGMLLDAYQVTDEGVLKGIRQKEKKGKQLACAKGCSTCCVTHRSIPSYPLELVGISWFATEILEGPVRKALMDRLFEHKKGDPCAFLIDGACSIHPMRPMACRQFNVFTRPCEEGEDAYYTRRKDVLTPRREYTDKAFWIMLPFYGVKDRASRRQVVESGKIHDLAKDMQSMNWVSLAKKMMEFDVHRTNRPQS